MELFLVFDHHLFNLLRTRHVLCIFMPKNCVLFSLFARKNVHTWLKSTHLKRVIGWPQHFWIKVHVVIHFVDTILPY